ncbi:hypothetical protein [Maritimibacter alkaliphilus]|uniref:hypothetical protein n=1 Tax=Maritimibacter alkaliphilus TaxID=404236 RepID=UPI001C980943|nr:hypothetical protein [Maritimibacter alkaliphilus]MBY6091074.1 hypothetical protein [Maritimibacter alkaliphilus]
MSKPKTISRPATGGRFIRDKATGALSSDADKQAQDAQAELVAEAEPAAAKTPARSSKGT